MSQIKCLYGFNKTANTLHHINEAINDRTLELVCPSCMKKLTTVNGNVRAKHFRHDSSDHDNHCSESALHIRAKTMISELMLISLPIEFDIDVFSVQSLTIKTKRLRSSHLEAAIAKSNLELRIYNGRIIPDCTLIVDFGDGVPRSVCIEVCVTHAIDEKKHREIIETNSIFAEIDLSSVKRDISDEELLLLITDPTNYKIDHAPEPEFELIKYKHPDWSEFYSEQAEVQYKNFLEEVIDSKASINLYKQDLTIEQISINEQNNSSISIKNICIKSTSILLTSTLGNYTHQRENNPYPHPEYILEEQLKFKLSVSKASNEHERIKRANHEFDLFIAELRNKQPAINFDNSPIAPLTNIIKSSGAVRSSSLYGNTLLIKIITLILKGLSNGNFLPQSISNACLANASLPTYAELTSLRNRQVHLSKNIHGSDYASYYDITKNKTAIDGQLVKKSDLVIGLIHALEPEIIKSCVNDVITYFDHHKLLNKLGTSGLREAGDISTKGFFESYFNKKYYRDIRKVCDKPTSISKDDNVLISHMRSDLIFIKSILPDSNLSGYQRMLDSIGKFEQKSSSIPAFSVDTIEVPF